MVTTSQYGHAVKRTLQLDYCGGVGVCYPYPEINKANTFPPACGVTTGQHGQASTVSLGSIGR